MLEGGLDAVFFSIYVGQGELTPEGYKRAYDQDMEKFASVHRLAEQLAPDKIEIAYRADDVAKINAKGKKIALMGVENAYGIGTDLTNIKKFYDQGARYMSLSHNGHSQFSDSNTGERDNVSTDIETILGGSAADILKGAGNNNRIVGNGGNDTLIGLGGNDTLEGGAGTDLLNGGEGNDLEIQ
jgi:Ca2+-binding RTX toxin-like protein